MTQISGNHASSAVFRANFLRTSSMPATDGLKSFNWQLPKLSRTKTSDRLIFVGAFLLFLTALGGAAYGIPLPAPTFSPVAGTYTGTQTVTISDSMTPTAIYYTTNGTTPTTSSTKYTGPITVSATETIEAIAIFDGPSSPVATAAYTIIDVATPTFSPVAGTYTGSANVTISDATSGATIYYSTNGTTPTTSSTKYTGPVTVSTTETVKAIASAGGATGAVGSAAYTITPLATPTFSPAGGAYSSSQSVTISDTTSGATIYYTTNGTTPTTSSTKYTAPITVSATEIVEAIASAGGATSAVGTAAYTFGTKTAVALSSSLNPSTYGNSVTFTATVAPSAATGTMQFKNGGVNLGSPVTLSGGKATYSATLASGTHSITATYSGNSTYGGSTSSTLTQTVNKAKLTVAAPFVGRPYGQSNPTFTATYTGFVNGDTSSVLSGTPSLTTTATSTSPVGNAYAITTSQGTLSAANYSFSLQSGGLQVIGTLSPPTLAIAPDAGDSFTATLTALYPMSGISCTYTAGIENSSGTFPIDLNSNGLSGTGTIDITGLPSANYTATCNFTIAYPTDSTGLALGFPPTMSLPQQAKQQFNIGPDNCDVEFGDEQSSAPDNSNPPASVISWTLNYSVTVGDEQANLQAPAATTGTTANDPAYTDCNGNPLNGTATASALTEGSIAYDDTVDPPSVTLTYNVVNWQYSVQPNPNCAACDKNPSGYLQNPDVIQVGPNTVQVVTDCSVSSGSVARKRKK
jgi:hypothetical protein